MRCQEPGWVPLSVSVSAAAAATASLAGWVARVGGDWQRAVTERLRGGIYFRQSQAPRYVCRRIGGGLEVGQKEDRTDAEDRNLDRVVGRWSGAAQRLFDVA